MKNLIIIFGATGDLVIKKLYPALNLIQSKNSQNLDIVFVGRRDLNKDTFTDLICSSSDMEVEKDEFYNSYDYFRMEFQDNEKFKELSSRFSNYSNIFFYFAVPQTIFPILIETISKSDIKPNWNIIIEKPFGYNKSSAIELNDLLSKHFKEENIYRIDHYLGKSLVRMIPEILNNNEDVKGKIISKIEIITNEKRDVADRGEFYDQNGALRDVGQNHLLEIAAFIINGSENRAESIKKIHILNENEIKEQTKREQYFGYLDVKGVKLESKVETYFEINTFVELDNGKVPLFLSAGKKLPKERKEIGIYFTDDSKLEVYLDDRHNICYYSTDKSYCIYTSGESKKQYTVEYAIMLEEALEMNKQYFVSFEEILAEWDFVDPIEISWEKNLVPLKIYDDSKKFPLGEVC